MVVAELIQSICPPTFDFTYMPQVLALLAKQFTVLEVDTILAEEAKGKHN